MPTPRLVALVLLRAATLFGVAALVAGPLAGCDGTRNDDFESLLVVSASLGTGEPFPPVQLSRTSPLLDRYDPDAVFVRGARVTVTLLAPDGSDEQTTVYGEGDGAYVPLATVPTVEPGRTYRLDVAVGGETLRATTTVPPTLTVVEGPSERVTYGAGQGPELRIRQTSTPGRQAAFVASTRALSPAEFQTVAVDGETRYRSVPGTGFLPVPLYQRFLDCEPEAAGTILCEDNPRENAVTGTSPVINEDSYISLGDGTALVQVPFLAFGFYGPYRISLVSVDAALQTFVQTQAVQGGGTTLSPGEIPNVTTNVEGGLGVFGSYSRVAVETEIVQP